MFGGSQKAQLRLQYERNILVTLARALKVDQCMKTRASQAPRQWKAWLARESRIRLIHCIFRAYCLKEAMKALLISHKSSSVSSSFYSIANRFSRSMNSPMSSPVGNHYGAAEMPTTSSMCTRLIKVGSYHFLLAILPINRIFQIFHALRPPRLT